MEDDGNSSNSTNDKNNTAEKIQGGETSHIIKNDANNITAIIINSSIANNSFIYTFSIMETLFF